MDSVLSYWRSYFNPVASAPYVTHSTGQIALHLHEWLRGMGPVLYLDHDERPTGLEADLLVAHFWAFAGLAAANSFTDRIAVYVVSDPGRTKALMEVLAERFAVPVPYWDLPPPSFDHESTMEAAGAVLLVGNRYTLETFPARWHDKIELVNYGVDAEVFARDMGVERRREFCYVATHCGLRKGFPDVVRTWAGMDPRRTRLHVVGRMDSPYAEMLTSAAHEAVSVHGWIESRSDAYLRVLQGCRFAFIPTYSEGQMGTLLEVIHSGCIPITTAASGVDGRVLAHCLLVEPLDVEGQRAAIDIALSWSDDECDERRDALVAAAHEYHSWERFEAGAARALQRCHGGAAGG